MEQVGEQFHGLTLLSHCGGGAYGEVWYCQDISGKKLALKIISKKKLGNQWKKELKGVQNYRKITENQLGLLQIFHVGEDDETFYYTMEPADNVGTDSYVPDTLALRLQNGPLSPEEYPAIFDEIFKGIKAIHTEGFSHCDIKPDNILFVKGKPKLADIGLMSAVSVTVTHLAGTIGFMPPEISNGAAEYDRKSRQRSDLYAFGKVIYCTITGRSPEWFPSAQPKKILAEKLYYRLSLNLSNNDPSCRLTDIGVLSEELSEIRRKLEYGETWWDIFTYHRKNFLLKVKHNKKYIFVIFAFLLLLSLCGFFAMKAFAIKPVAKDKPVQKDETVAKDKPVQKDDAAKQESVEEQVIMAERYYKGLGVEKNLPKAIEWYRKAAEGGSSAAQRNLGIFYYEGIGVKKNYSEAVKWHRMAAEQGDIISQYNLGICYYNGEGIERNRAEAVKWFRKSAEGGNASAQFNMGVCLANGDGVAQDKVEAVMWYRKSADQKNANAQRNLGICYLKGDGVAQNRVEAVKLFHKSAAQGNAQAQACLGLCYEKGYGVKKNTEEAVKWYSMAVKQNYEPSKRALKRLEKQIIDELKRESDKAPDGMRKFTFGGGRYSFFIPNQWRVDERETIDDGFKRDKNFTEMQNDTRIRKHRNVWAYFYLKDEKGKSLNARAELSIESLTSTQIDTLSNQEIAAHFGKDLLGGKKLKRYKPFREFESLIILFGRTEKGEECEIYLLPRKKHCIKLTLTKGSGASKVFLFQLLETFREHNVVVQKQSGDSRTPLMLALWDRNLSLADKLLKEGADINETVYSGSTALHLAVEENQLDAVKFLLNHNADPNIQDSGLETPLHIAARNGNTEILSALLQKKADLNVQDSLKYTPLCYAARNSHIACMTKLLQAGAKWDIPRNEDWGTPILLHIIIAKNSPEIENLLISHGVPKITLESVKKRLKPYLLK